MFCAVGKVKHFIGCYRYCKRTISGIFRKGVGLRLLSESMVFLFTFHMHGIL